MKKSLIYTRTGDKGTTSLVGGERVSKTDVRLEAYGTVDELNAHLGVLISLMDDAEFVKLLRNVQHCLFSVGAFLATNQENKMFPDSSVLTAEAVLQLEEAIDKTDSSLPSLKAFVLPGGCLAASYCHVCRTVCRRAERRILALEEQVGIVVDETIKRFVNRLSDFLFVLSRKLNQMGDEKEIFWDKSCK